MLRMGVHIANDTQFKQAMKVHQLGVVYFKRPHMKFARYGRQRRTFGHGTVISRLQLRI